MQSIQIVQFPRNHKRKMKFDCEIIIQFNSYEYNLNKVL